LFRVARKGESSLKEIKKLTSFTPMFFMFVILAVLLIFMCLPTGQIEVHAKNGILDFSNESTNGNLYSLRGEWQFYYGDFLASGENDVYETIEVPSSWTNAANGNYPLNGGATYRLIIKAAQGREYMLYVPDIPSSYVIFINGEQKAQAGTVSLEASVMQYRNTLIPIEAKNGNIEIVIHAANHSIYHSGLVAPLIFGEYETIMSWFIQTRTLYSIALGCILMMAFYHFTLFIFRRHEKVYLMFSLLCFLCFVRFLIDVDGINRFMQWLKMDSFGMDVSTTAFFLHSAAIIFFSLYVFSKMPNVIVSVIYMVSGFILFTIVPKNNTYILAVMSIFMFASIGYCIIAAIRSPILRKIPLVWLYFIALLLYMFVGSAGILLMRGEWFMTGVLTNMFLIMSQSLVLSRRYTDAFRFVEETNQNLEKIVDERTKSLQVVNETMKELVSNISHDLKTPLHILSVNLETLSGLAVTQSDADYQRYVRGAYQKNLDLQRLIQNLFEVSRIETGKSVYSAEWLSVFDLLSQSKEKYGIYLEDNGISFEVDVEDDFEIKTDPQKIWNVFDNIIYNAVRHTQNGGKIIIEAQNAESTAVLKISDTGCGIEAKHLPLIFDRFYKVSKERSTKEGESGLGLYIVKSVMEGCGGSVNVESEVGKGTSVILNFVMKT
jgi:signal transduction histidine kinase